MLPFEPVYSYGDIVLKVNVSGIVPSAETGKKMNFCTSGRWYAMVGKVLISQIMADWTSLKRMPTADSFPTIDTRACLFMMGLKVLVCFTFLTAIAREKQVKGGKTDFGSWFKMVQSMVT